MAAAPTSTSTSPRLSPDLSFRLPAGSLSSAPSPRQGGRWVGGKVDALLQQQRMTSPSPGSSRRRGTERALGD